MPDSGVPPADPLGVFATDMLTGRVAVVTGGGRGIGRAIALGMARCGAKVVVAGRKPDGLDHTKAAVAERGGECLAVQTDIRDVDQVEALRDAALDRFGGVDFVVNNAGGQFPSKPTAISDRGWRSVVDTNLNGTWNMCQRFMPAVAEAGSGSIVNMVHNFVFDRGAPFFVHSGAARAGVVSLTRSLAPFLAAKGATINAVAPGSIDTSAFIDEELGSFAVDASTGKALAEKMGVQRFGTADEVAALVVFLCSPAARYVNGSVLVVDNGMTQMNWPLLDMVPFSDM